MKYYKACSVVKGKYKSLAVAEMTEIKRKGVIREKREITKYLFWYRTKAFLSKVKTFLAYRFLIRTYAIGKWTKPLVGKLMVFEDQNSAEDFTRAMGDSFDTKVFECVSDGPAKRVDYLLNIDMDLAFAKEYWKMYEKEQKKHVSSYIRADMHAIGKVGMSTLGHGWLVDSVMLTKEV